MALNVQAGARSITRPQNGNRTHNATQSVVTPRDNSKDMFDQRTCNVHIANVSAASVEKEGRRSPSARSNAAKLARLKPYFSSGHAYFCRNWTTPPYHRTR